MEVCTSDEWLPQRAMLQALLSGDLTDMSHPFVWGIFVLNCVYSVVVLRPARAYIYREGQIPSKVFIYIACILLWLCGEGRREGAEGGGYTGDSGKHLLEMFSETVRSCETSAVQSLSAHGLADSWASLGGWVGMACGC